MIVEELHHHEKGLLELLHSLDGKIGHVVSDISGIAFLVNFIAAQACVPQIAIRVVIRPSSAALEHKIIEPRFPGIGR